MTGLLVLGLHGKWLIN